MNIARKLYEQNRSNPVLPFSLGFTGVAGVIATILFAVWVTNEGHGMEVEWALYISLGYWIPFFFAIGFLIIDKVVEAVTKYVTCNERTVRSLIYRRIYGDDFRYIMSDPFDVDAMSVCTLVTCISAPVMPVILLFILPWSVTLNIVLFALGVGCIALGLKIARATYIASGRLKKHINDPDAHKRNQ